MATQSMGYPTVDWLLVSHTAITPKDSYSPNGVRFESTTVGLVLQHSIYRVIYRVIFPTVMRMFGVRQYNMFFYQISFIFYHSLPYRNGVMVMVMVMVRVFEWFIFLCFLMIMVMYCAEHVAEVWSLISVNKCSYNINTNILLVVRCYLGEQFTTNSACSLVWCCLWCCLVDFISNTVFPAFNCGACT